MLMTCAPTSSAILVLAVRDVGARDNVRMVAGVTD
jgi:hypothetical protein